VDLDRPQLGPCATDKFGASGPKRIWPKAVRVSLWIGSIPTSATEIAAKEPHDALGEGLCDFVCIATSLASRVRLAAAVLKRLVRLSADNPAAGIMRAEERVGRECE